MAQPNIDLTDVIADIRETVGVQQSATTLINTFQQRMLDAALAAVKADDDADQATVDTIMTALRAEVAAQKASTGELAAAVAANPSS